jgi:intein/homing endonuclease
MKLPSYSIPEGMTEDKALVKACMQGLIWRGLDDKPEYIERLKYELKIIKDKKFSNYFLTMKKILDIARENMLLGPGRGCFLPHSRVKMSDGLYAPISTISIGDTVVDAYGNNQKVIDTLTYDVDEELVRLEFEDGKIIECTKDHEILTHNRGWVHAQDINENDDVVEV